MIKILLGGSPCTFWSIAQKNNRETNPSGLGWELFENYLIAKEKFKPDIFLYENNKSAAQAIKDEIKKRFKVDETDARYIEINSALVSAQNRQRFYVHNCGEVQQPEDRGILLRDILETGVVDREKAYCLKCQQGNARDYFKKRHTQIAFEQSEPVRIGDIGSNAQAHRVYSCDGKSVTIKAGGGGQGGKTGLYACPINITQYGKSQTIKSQYYKNSIANFCCYYSTYGASGVAEPIRSEIMPVKEATGKGYTEIEPGECVDLQFPNSTTRRGRKMKEKSNCLTKTNEFYEYLGTIHKPIYEVKDGKITINGKQYPIKLADGFYIIRKLTVTECCRLQTMPDDYCRAVSNTQAYKGLGNGWTAEVIIHILNGALKDVPRDEEIVVLSMYDGIGTGRYCLDKMGFTNVKYYAYEIDKYAKQIAMSNYSDIIQCGDAYQVRNDDWNAPQ